MEGRERKGPRWDREGRRKRGDSKGRQNRYGVRQEKSPEGQKKRKKEKKKKEMCSFGDGRWGR